MCLGIRASLQMEVWGQAAGGGFSPSAFACVLGSKSDCFSWQIPLLHEPFCQLLNLLWLITTSSICTNLCIKRTNTPMWEHVVQKAYHMYGINLHTLPVMRSMDESPMYSNSLPHNTRALQMCRHSTAHNVFISFISSEDRLWQIYQPCSGLSSLCCLSSLR